MMEPCLFSVSYAGYWGQDSLALEPFIAKAKELGYRAVMLAGKRPHLSPLDMHEGRIAEIAETLRRHEVRCAVVGGYTDFAGTTAAEVPYLEMQIDYVATLAHLAARLGASVVRVFTGYESDATLPQVAWSKVVTGLRECCDRAAEHGVTIAVQNHHDVAVHSEALLELLSDIDRANCRVGFDAWSPALRGEPLYEAARKLAPYTAITTNADYIRLPRFRYQPEVVNYRAVEPDLVRAVRFGTGFIDYPAFFRGLADGGFQGVATYEMCSPLRGGGSMANLDAYARHYLAWMREQGFAT